MQSHRGPEQRSLDEVLQIGELQSADLRPRVAPELRAVQGNQGKGRGRPLRWYLGLSSVLLVGGLGLQPVSARTEEPRAVLSLRIIELRGKLDEQGNAPGKVGCSLYSGPDGYPTEPAKALQKAKCTIRGRSAQCRFAPIPRGTYAVACVHDENGNGTLDTNWIGIPTEGTVASNHAKGVMGPPKFEDAKFPFEAEPKQLKLTMGY